MAEQKIDNRIKALKHEHIIIFCSEETGEQVWLYNYRVGDKYKVAEIKYNINQDPESIYQRASGLIFELDEEDNITIILNNLCEEFDEVLVKSLAESNGDELKVFRDFCYFLDENRDICYALLSDNGDINFLLKMRAIISRRCFSNIPKDYIKSYGKNDYIYIISYFESGTVGILRYWLSDESDGRKSSEEIALILKTLFMEGLNGMTNK